MIRRRLSKILRRLERIVLTALVSIVFCAIYIFSWTLVPLPAH